MSETENNNKLTLNTPIQMTIKMFGSLIFGMLILFFGFYKIVVAPKIIEHDTKFLEQENTHVEEYRLINSELMKINNGIGTLNGTVNGMNNRFNDIRNLRSSENTSGGFNN